MSADTLRRAAALMRERAEDATPGEWSRLPGASNVWHFPDLSGRPVLVAPGNGTQGHHLRAEDAEHIASWHPAVALAVADWLDGAALHLEARADEEWFDLDGDPISPEDTHAIGSALAVARAFLGEDA